jgi:protein-S-isoprenylcysteine O-methyltransferase Ste14
MSSTGGDREEVRLPELGKRGGGWVAGQVLVIAAVFLSALVGRGWGDSYAIAAYAVGGTLFALGFLLLATAGLQLGTSLTPFPAPKDGQTLTTTGAFALVRHPMYGGGVLIGLGWTIIFASVVGLGVTLVLAVFLDLKSRREEAWLDESLDDYTAYREQTPHRLMPFLY